MSRVKQVILQQLAARRQAAGLSRSVVAGRMRTSEAAVGRLDSGRTDPRWSSVERFAAAIGVDLDVGIRGTQTSAGSTAETARMLGLDTGNFWAPPRPVEELMEEQGIVPIQDPRGLVIPGLTEEQREELVAAVESGDL